MRSVPAIIFDVRPSRWLMLALMAVAILAVVAVMLCALPLWLRLALAVVVVGYAAQTLHGLRHPKLAKVGWRSDETWGLRLIDGTETEGELRTSRVLGAMIVLRLSWAPRGRAALVLLPDNMDADTRRRLRMRLSAQADTN